MFYDIGVDGDGGPMTSNVKYAGFWGEGYLSTRGTWRRDGGPLRVGLERRLVGSGRSAAYQTRPTRTPRKRSGRWPAQDLYHCSRHSLSTTSTKTCVCLCFRCLEQE